ncbi:MAG: serine-threonine protein kinase, partial [Actinomycetota bacterium]|nr:serine-threonine protein kinase [Actinomycetota bacterium]
MTAEIAGLPFWEMTFDADGDPDAAQRATFLTEVRGRGITDLIIFSHGWNNDRRVARMLYDRFFGILAGQLRHVPPDRPTTVGLAGVLWPSQLWSDEQIPDFAAPAESGGAASLTDPEPADEAAADPTLDQETLTSLRELFPAAVEPIDQMARLLTVPPTDQTQREFHQHLKEFSAR